MPSLSIAAVVGDFPTFQVAFGGIEGVRPMPSAPAEIEAFVASAEDAARARLDEGEPAALPEVLRWRAAYRAFGSKKTSYRDACEALLRRLAAGDHLPRILPLVDLYNAISVKHVMPVGVDDLALLAPPNAFRYAKSGDSFLDGGTTPPADDPPAPGEVVYADTRHCLCRRWNWRQDARTRVSAGTRDALVVIQTLEADGAERLARAIEDFASTAKAALGAQSRWAIASAAMPVVSV
jgi:DNA/RNA-binding domain of Phe-tRNA-synthetase-like protein